MLDDNDNVDAEVLAESVSDMLNNEFSKSVSEILETCGERLAAGGSQLCPPPEVICSLHACKCLILTSARSQPRGRRGARASVWSTRSVNIESSVASECFGADSYDRAERDKVRHRGIRDESRPRAL